MERMAAIVAARQGGGRSSRKPTGDAAYMYEGEGANTLHTFNDVRARLRQPAAASEWSDVLLTPTEKWKRFGTVVQDTEVMCQEATLKTPRCSPHLKVVASHGSR